ncbi:PiggyBac transposable element-derived protein 4 [Plakobranchus ocellatus]|uniref:PiggyBac transposable element-derived protein 4 n=1 Tax=Plakobranchus ocellatus TaxID=259542 RepID=A0AAV4A8D2_9GAST|nr:PiggyBac transposable element-derived protein 4 [Plakobranchus ocellatus]
MKMTGFHMSLSDFHVQAASGLIKVQRPPGRPLSDSFLPPGNGRQHAVGIRPVLDVRYDNLGHFPEWISRVRCKAACPGFTYVFCVKCKVHFCFNKDRNCFVDYHKK